MKIALFLEPRLMEHKRPDGSSLHEVYSFFLMTNFLIFGLEIESWILVSGAAFSRFLYFIFVLV